MILRDERGRFIKGLRPSLETEFKEGHIPWNKGKKGIHSSPGTEFKKGLIPWMKGRHHTIKTKEILRQVGLGRHHSKKTKEKMSEAHKGKHEGKNNHFWKGGISLLRKRLQMSYQWRQWRSDIFTRDNFTCQECGQVSGYINAHHIKSYSSIIQKYEITTLEEAFNCAELWNINNGITLCEKCHGTNWKEYFRNKVELKTDGNS